MARKNSCILKNFNFNYFPFFKLSFINFNNIVFFKKLNNSSNFFTFKNLKIKKINLDKKCINVVYF